MARNLVRNKIICAKNALVSLLARAFFILIILLSIVFLSCFSLSLCFGKKGNEVLFLFSHTKISLCALIANIVSQHIFYNTTRFIVNEDGTLTDYKIMRSLSLGLDAEALRVARLMPNWILGKENGVPVRVEFDLPVRFVW